MTRRDHPPIVPVVLLALVIALAGCEGDDTAPPSTARGPAAASATPTFDSPEALLAHLKTLRTGEDRLAMMDLVYTETMTEDYTRRFARSIAAAELQFARAINEAFAGDGEPVIAEDLGMTSFHEAMQDAEIELINPVTARVTGTGTDGTEHVVVLERRGTWKIHVSTLNGGEPVNDVWYSGVQTGFGGRLKYTRDVTIQVRTGEFESAEEAQARLAELMSGRMPPLGSVTPD